MPTAAPPAAFQTPRVSSSGDLMGSLDAKSKREANEARREAMRNMLYRKDS